LGKSGCATSSALVEGDSGLNKMAAPMCVSASPGRPFSRRRLAKRMRNAKSCGEVSTAVERLKTRESDTV
jgi:hypothetical protein